jgi:hypothetical protein
MSLETSSARQSENTNGFGALEPLYTRDEVAARWHVKKQWVTRNYWKIGLHPIKRGKRLLFPHSQIVEADRRAVAGE